MAYPFASELQFPMKNWKPNDTKHLQVQQYGGVDWGKHLGEDCVIKPGTPVLSIAKGKVVYSALHTSVVSPKKEGQKGSNWGNVIIIAHKNPKNKKLFFSVYGHLKKRLVKKGDKVKIGQKIGSVAKGWTKENGWWKEAHLHFAIYVGPWLGAVLPGAFKDRKRTKLKYWIEPTKFIKNY